MTMPTDDFKGLRNFLRERLDEGGYGFARPENPNDFHPDPECCSEEEIANHKAACEAWDRGDYKAPLGSESHHNEKGELTLHILRAPWGIGSYSFEDPECRKAMDEFESLLAELDRVREDAARLDHLESMVQLGKIEIARSLLGAGYEFGHWVKGPTAKVHSGSLRAAIDAARGKGKEGGS